MYSVIESKQQKLKQFVSLPKSPNEEGLCFTPQKKAKPKQNSTIGPCTKSKSCP